MRDPYVVLGWRILRALPQDDSDATYEAVLAVHSLVWELWRRQSAHIVTEWPEPLGQGV